VTSVFSSASSGAFWGSVGVTHVLAWGFLGLAGRITRTAWQDKPATVTRLRWRDRFRSFFQGRARTRALYRRRLLDLNPVTWLAARDRLKPVYPWIFLGIMAVVLASGVATAQNSGVSSGYPVPKGDLTPPQQTGAGLYKRYCVGCHGVKGDGNGENAPYIDPKPRDFTLAQFKCRSTPTGTLPLDSDLIHTLQRGVRGSNMPSWLPLSPENWDDLVAYIKTFSSRWKTEKPGDPIPIPTEPEVTADRVKAGQQLFQRLEVQDLRGEHG